VWVCVKRNERPRKTDNLGKKASLENGLSSATRQKRARGLQNRPEPALRTTGQSFTRQWLGEKTSKSIKKLRNSLSGATRLPLPEKNDTQTVFKGVGGGGKVHRTN